MSSSGESLSLFVVQRTFTRVRRGYDPVEVDRHLQLVSSWFSQNRMGQMARDIEARAAEAEQHARRTLEGAQLEADATLEGARRAADALLAEARRDADAERERILAAARAEAEQAAAHVRAEAEQAATQVRAEAEQAATQARAQAEQELQAYVDRRRREADRLAQRARGS
jgi:DivIVA domain-containing protein